MFIYNCGKKIGGAGHTCKPSLAAYLFLDYTKGAKPQPYSCPQGIWSGLSPLHYTPVHMLGGRKGKLEYIRGGLGVKEKNELYCLHGKFVFVGPYICTEGKFAYIFGF